MKRLKTFALVSVMLLFANQSARLESAPLPERMSRQGGVDAGNLAAILLSSFIIGNAVAWAMGAYPHDFPRQPFSREETEQIADLTAEARDNPGEASVKVELGRLYFHHNELDQAETQLDQAVNLEPANAEALAIFYANEAKQAGAMWDFTWGLFKLNRMEKVVNGLNQAVAMEPGNFTVRLYRMNTLVGFREKKGNFHKIFEDEAWFLGRIAASPSIFPEEVKRAFYQVLAEAYGVAAELADSPERQAENRKKADDYRLLLSPMAVLN